jgi:hypothetical protein
MNTCKRFVKGVGVAGMLAAALVLAVHLTAPPQAEASIHEIIAALCRAGGEEVVPFGQNKQGGSFLRALQATGFLTSIDTSDPDQVVLNFDPTVPNSKFISAGFDLTIPNGVAPGVDLVLSPLVVPNLDFPAHSHCNNLQ